jgi:UrcA family protein
MSKMLLVAAVAAAFLAGPAAAYQLRTDVDGRPIRVVALPAGRVDFSDAAQVRAFYAKVKRAADEACMAPSVSGQIMRPDAECSAQAVSEAVRNANRPTLTAAYDSDISPTGAVVRSAGVPDGASTK